MTAMDNMNDLKELLAKECDYKLPDNIMDRFLGMMDEIQIKAKELLIRGGVFDDNIYFLKEGIMCDRYFDGNIEKTHVFSLPGTMMISLHSYYMRIPAFFHVEACCDSTVMRITKKNFDKLTDEYHEFAKWITRMLFCQLYFFEMKLALIHGSAKERFISLIKNRPEIIANCSNAIIASYLGITQSYLSRLKKRLYVEEKTSAK